MKTTLVNSFIGVGFIMITVGACAYFNRRKMPAVVTFIVLGLLILASMPATTFIRAALSWLLD
jgi:multisubunit Na+/H+ antiporter MnhG subunit